jgi:lysozyme family protein
MILTLSGYTQSGIIQDIVGIEGGSSDNPNDPGGNTKYGITQATANSYAAQLKAQFSWDGTMANLTVAMATWIYVQGYWNKLSLDQVVSSAPIIAHKLFDIGVNLSLLEAGQYLQNALNVFSKAQSWYSHLKVDGNVGPTTISTLNTYLQKRGNTTGQWHLALLIASQQSVHYMTDAQNSQSQETFEDGWQDRVGQDIAGYARALSIVT